MISIQIDTYCAKPNLEFCKEKNCIECIWWRINQNNKSKENEKSKVF